MTYQDAQHVNLANKLVAQYLENVQRLSKIDVEFYQLTNYCQDNVCLLTILYAPIVDESSKQEESDKASA